MAAEAFHRLAPSKKYLLFLSYFGSEFRGIQKQPPNFHHGHLIIVNTVQETLEKAMEVSLRPKNDVIVGLSSRTDAGVHALRTSVDCTLILPGRQSNPDIITSELNKNFLANDVGMRIQSTHLVPNWFSARRHATSRTYVYRFAIRKEPPVERMHKHTTEIPFSEHHRTLFLQSPECSIDRMQEVISLITGTRDYFAFMGKPTKAGTQLTIKSIYSLTLTPTHPFMPQHDANAGLFNYWNLTCTGRSFLYRQIRRMMGVIIAVGQGSMNIDGVKRLLNEPCMESWDPRAVCVPPWGLYLADVTYNPLDINPDLVKELEDEEEHLEKRVTYALST